MTEPLKPGKYDLTDLNAFDKQVGSIFDDYGDGDDGGSDNGQCQELSDRIAEINERLADPTLSRYLEMILLKSLYNLTQQLRRPPCGGRILAPSR